MKRAFILFLLAVLFNTASFSQGDVRPVKEVGLVSSGLNSFGMVYRSGTETSLWRFGLAFTDIRFEQEKAQNTSEKFSSLGTNSNFRVGREKRQPITEKLDFRFGADLSLGGGFFSQKSSESGYDRSSWYVNPGVDLVIGINYKLGNRLLLGAELLPGADYRFASETREFTGGMGELTTNESGITFGFSNYGALLSLVWQL